MTSPFRDFVPFELERWQSRWEHATTHNLSESGVQPLSPAELFELTGEDPAPLLNLRLGYGQTNGTKRLRAAVAAKYPGATPDNVLITVGSSEANFVSLWTMVGPGDRVAMQLPAYEQAWGLIQNLGGSLTPFHLMRGDTWTLDEAGVEAAITSGTKLVFVTNPNNPTGHVLDEAERRAIIERADHHGAWLLADEVYRGAELTGTATPSFWGTTERVIVTGGLSKAYGLPGLRIGWVVAPTSVIDAVVDRHDYAVIGPAVLSDAMAVIALTHESRLLQRTRHILNSNYAVVARWFETLNGFFMWVPPRAGAIFLADYTADIAARDLVEMMRQDHDVLLVPGEQFHLERCLRFGYGYGQEGLVPALAAVKDGLRHLLTN